MNAEPGSAPCDDEAWLDSLGGCLVLAPHPDDESLGCGGLIAMLRKRDASVSVVLVSDGSQSHPGSHRYPPSARRALRRAEMERALAILGVAREDLHALDLPDGAVPGERQPGFDAAVSRIAALASRCGARTLLAPWRRDPHPDHRAVSAMARAVRGRLRTVTRIVEYGVWTDERGTVADRPRPGEVDEHRLDVSSVAAAKAGAVAAHASQRGQMILDDPGGFVLPASLLERCAGPIETYLQAPMAPHDAEASPA